MGVYFLGILGFSALSYVMIQPHIFKSFHYNLYLTVNKLN